VYLLSVRSEPRLPHPSHMGAAARASPCWAAPPAQSVFGFALHPPLRWGVPRCPSRRPSRHPSRRLHCAKVSGDPLRQIPSVRSPPSDPLRLSHSAGPALIVAVSTSGNEKLFKQHQRIPHILQSIQLPSAMLPVLHLSAQKHLLGRFRSGQVATAITLVLVHLRSHRSNRQTVNLQQAEQARR
jgi:hypothetical protein